MRLTGTQRHALSIIANNGGSRVEPNNWVSANSLIRKGLATKEPTTEPLTSPFSEEDQKTSWGVRYMRLARARYTLTEAGRQEVRDGT